MASVDFLRYMTRTCQLGEILETVLARSGAAQTGKVLTYEVSKGSSLYKKIPGLFRGVKNPHLQYGYENGEANSFFAQVMDGQNVCRKIKYKKAQGTYTAEIAGTNEHLNCVYKPDKPLLNLSESGFHANTGVRGTPDNMVDFLLNLNNSALRVEGRVARERFGSTMNAFIPSQGRISIHSGVEGTPVGRTDIGLNYHGSDMNLELQNSHLQKVKKLFVTS